jgi:phospholipid transport system substrate-binding protein
MRVLSKFHYLAAGLALLAVALGSGAATTSGPMATVKSASDEIIDVLSDPEIPRRDRWERIAPIIADNFDFRAMSMSILSREWQSATKGQQKEFVRFFSRYIEATYRSKIEAYSGQRIEYTGEKIRGGRASVSSIIHAGSTQIPVSYYLRQDLGGSWKAYDITIEGVSLVNSYRETYAAIAKTSGMNGILADVKRRVREQREAQAASGTQ